MRGRDKFTRSKPIINLILVLLKLFPTSLRCWYMRHCRMVQGYKGLIIRFVLLKSLAKSCGDNVSVQSGVYLFNIQNLTVGDNVSIHPMCYIEAAGEINIGNDVSIAHGCTIMSTTHTFDKDNLPIKDQLIKYKKVQIQDNVWIGAKATILAGVIIESGTIIAANSVVNKNISSDVIAGGVPAKIIKKRS